MSCARHIQANMRQKFGKQCAKFVCSIAKSFSTRNASLLLDEIQKVKPEAARYLESITVSGVLWQSTQWYSDSLSPSPAQLPPRYGIVTSNTSESANSMLSEARILGIMTTRVCTCQKSMLSEMDRRWCLELPRF